MTKFGKNVGENQIVSASSVIMKTRGLLIRNNDNNNICMCISFLNNQELCMYVYCV